MGPISTTNRPLPCWASWSLNMGSVPEDDPRGVPPPMLKCADSCSPKPFPIIYSWFRVQNQGMKQLVTVLERCCCLLQRLALARSRISCRAWSTTSRRLRLACDDVRAVLYLVGPWGERKYCGCAGSRCLRASSQPQAQFQL